MSGELPGPHIYLQERGLVTQSSVIESYKKDPHSPEKNYQLWEDFFNFNAEKARMDVVSLLLPPMNWTREEIAKPFPTKEGDSLGLMIPDFITPDGEGFYILGKLVHPNFRSFYTVWKKGVYSHPKPTNGWVKVQMGETAGNTLSGEMGEVGQILDENPDLRRMPLTVYALFYGMHYWLTDKVPDKQSAILTGLFRENLMVNVQSSVNFMYDFKKIKEPTIGIGQSGSLIRGLGARFMQVKPT